MTRRHWQTPKKYYIDTAWHRNYKLNFLQDSVCWISHKLTFTKEKENNVQPHKLCFKTKGQHVYVGSLTNQRTPYCSWLLETLLHENSIGNFASEQGLSMSLLISHIKHTHAHVKECLWCRGVSMSARVSTQTRGYYRSLRAYEPSGHQTRQFLRLEACTGRWPK